MDAISYSYADKQAKRIKKFINDPDSTSGVVTVPKTIASGENITIPSGRVAILPNVQVDGTLNVQGDVFIPSGATLSKVVELDGNQTISDVKTFTSSPIVPTPTTGTQAVNKDYADTKITLSTANSYDLGVGQTWQDVSASRSFNVTYTNSTGKPITVSVTPYHDIIGGNTGILYFYVDNKEIASNRIGVNSTTNGGSSLVAIVPNGQTYSIGRYNNTTTINKWYELR